jgi:phage/plasmid-associated DNA primase
MAKNTKKKKSNHWSIELKHCTKSQLTTNLPNNFKATSLKIERETVDFEINSNHEYFRYIQGCARQYKEARSLANNGKTPKFKDLDVYKVLAKYKIFKIFANPISTTKGSKFQISYWMRDYDNTLNLFKPAEIDSVINVINSVFEISNFSSLITNVNKTLTTVVPGFNGFELLKSPPKEILLMKNGVLNTKTFEFSTNINEFGEFDFISKINFRMLDPDQTDLYYYNLANKLLNDWMDGNIEKVKYLKQLGISVIDGNGRDVYNIIIGPGGNGKSVYLNILSKLASGYDVNLDIQDLTDDNKLIELDESTKLIVGHELATNLKLSQNSISRMKQIATADPFKANVKFKDARTIVTNAVKIQATNTLPKIFENNDAILRRVKIITWTVTNFTKLETELPLDDIIQRDEFMEAFISLIFTDTEPFTKFMTIESIERDSREAVSNADQVSLFLDWMDDQGFLLGKIPTTILYEQYKIWNMQENPGSSPLKNREFIDRAKKLSAQFNMIYNDKQQTISSLKKNEFNADVLNHYYFNNQIKYNKYATIRLFECTNVISKDDIKEIKQKLVDCTLDEHTDLNFKTIMIIEYLVSKNNSDAIAFKELYIT